MFLTEGDLTAIPVLDVRDGGPVRHAVESCARARALRDDCLAWFPRPARAALPVLDRLARRWLMRSDSPYVPEVAAIAASLGFPGVWFLNGSYEWCCTSLAREQNGIPWLVRTLDWPFPGLGRNAEVTRMRGSVGDFWNVTWPGYVGALTAMAPGRFAAAVNQAPLRRRTEHPLLRLYDVSANALQTWRVRHIPPDHLLRVVFETCRTFAEARRQLETTPVAQPVIYTVAGCERGERCVIERTEESYATGEQDTVAANDWSLGQKSWEARVAGTASLTCSYEEAAGNSRARREALSDWRGRFSYDDFAWVTPPVLNPFTRIAVEMCPADGVLRAMGYELTTGSELPRPVTRVCEIAALAA